MTPEAALATLQLTMGELRVTGLYTYPVKSCAGVALKEATVSETGFELDREFMLVDQEHDFMSQRKLPEMALIGTAIASDSVVLSAPGMPDANIPLALDRDDHQLLTATVHGTPVHAQFVSEELDDWFTSFLPAHREHRRYRLVRVRPDLPRWIDDLYRHDGASNRVAFSDGASLLLASERSLAKLNRSLDEPVRINRFRPNIVIDGDGLAPYDEDHWTELRIGALRAFVTKGCDRCAIPDVDQSTATTGKGVRRALAAHRRGVNAYDETNTGVFFAQNLNHVFVPGARIAVGDPVEVVGRAESPNVRLRPAEEPPVGAAAL